eukprot:6585548-Prymnesium_polylepis.2
MADCVRVGGPYSRCVSFLGAGVGRLANFVALKSSGALSDYLVAYERRRAGCIHCAACSASHDERRTIGHQTDARGCGRCTASAGHAAARARASTSTDAERLAEAYANPLEVS